jgi:hypothetical protein
MINVAGTRTIKLYPGSDPNLQAVDPGFVSDDRAGELWIDCNIDVDLRHTAFDHIETVVFYDFFQVDGGSNINKIIRTIKQVAERFPTTWITANQLEVAGINTKKFDHLWNRSKAAYADKVLGWKHIHDVTAYAQHSIHFNNRSKKYLNLCRSSYDYRQNLYNFLQQFDGYSSNICSGKVLGNDLVSDKHIIDGQCVPPNREYFDNSYVSCQVESQYMGNHSIVFTEKTYDHLIQGRLVLNFGAPGFYQALAADGWAVPDNIDFSWDSEPNTATRFQAYLNMLRTVFESDLHELFLSNKTVIEHNYNRLYTKPYYKL